MKQIAKLKDEARKFEQREEWEKAIQAYIEVLRLAEQGDGSDMDLPLYNRVGDLYVRLGRSAEAVKYYEQAADKYAETGLYNNAIALCNKALRYDAGRVELLKKLGQFSASQGFFTDARRWYLEYCERMSKRGAIDQAFVALKELADLHDNPEIRELLARQLRDHGHTEQALEEFRRAYALRIAAGQTGEAQELRSEILALDPNANLEQGAATAAPHEPGPAAGSRNDLPGFIDFETASSQPVAFDGPSQPSTIEQEPLDIESPIPDYAAAESAPDIGAIDIEQPMVSGPPDLGEMERIDLGIESTAEFTPPAPGELETEQITDTFDLPTFDLNEIGTDLSGGFNLGLNDVQAEPAAAEAEAEAEEDVEPLPGFDEFDAPMSGTADDLPLMEVPDDSFRFSFDDEPDIPAGTAAGTFTEPDIAEEPAAPAEADTDTFVPPLDFELESYQGATDTVEETEEAPAPAEPEWVEETVRPVVEPEPEPDPLASFEEELEGSLGADAFLELEPEPEDDILPALEPEPEPEPIAFAPPPPPPPPPPAPAPSAQRPAPAASPAATSEYIDLASFLAEETEVPQSTRFVIAEATPTGDEEKDFADMLKQFKAKVAETIPREDAGSHYDLGLAFKEMGLLDEAIAEFQTALRGGQEKLKVLEELGSCFVQKQQYSVAVTVLNRALQMPHEDEADLLGVYYNLGRAHEELGQHAEARAAYERVISVDIGFQDTTERLAKL